ncbi:hypothetical protein F5Y10DRAFT_149877 [Nemania abortiva]|nr:hypothetical protein F5Y10DRAFT_149877 [Nemania abortiva]
MLRKIVVAWTLMVLAPVAFAAESANLTLNDIPQCGVCDPVFFGFGTFANRQSQLLCISSTLQAQSTCALTDFPCICANEALSKKIESCISSQCPPRDALTTAKIVKDLCGAPKRNISLAVWLVSLVNIVFSTLFYILRLVSRAVLRQRVDVSDVFLGISVAFTFPILWTAFSLAAAGLGQDAWNIPPDNITRIFYLYWWDEIFYQGGLPLTRISFLCFYLKLFPQDSIRKASFILIGLNVANFIAFVTASIFQCVPIYGAWTFWDGSFQGHCNDLHLQSWIQAGFNIGMDLMVIILPLPALAKLSISRSRKIRIVGMFSLGFFVTIISVLRLKTLVVFANSMNVSYDYVEPGLYSVIEACISIICACLPAVRALLITLMPNIFTLSANRSRLSSGKGVRDESSRQKFDRLKDYNSYDSPISPSSAVKPKWPIHNDAELFSDSKSESNVELMPMGITRTEVSVESGLREESDDKTARNTNWNWPLPH